MNARQRQGLLRGLWRIDPKSIRARLTLIFVLLVVLPAFAVVAMNAWISVRGGLQQAYDQLDSVASLKESSVTTWADHLQGDLANTLTPEDLHWHMSVLVEQAASLGLFRQVSYNRVKAAFRQIQLRSRLFDELFLLNRNGTAVLSTNSGSEDVEFGEYRFFREALSTFAIQYPSHVPPVDGYSVVAALPVTNEAGEVLGVLAGRASMARLNRVMLAREGLGETGETYLVDQSGSLLTPSRFGVPVGTIVGDSSFASVSHDGRNVHEHSKNYRDAHVLGVRRWVPALDVVLIAEREQAEAFASTYTALKVSLAVTAAGVLIAVSLGVLLTRNITEPLADLTRTAAKISAGDLDTAASVKGSTEIVGLSNAFNAMTARLRVLIEELKHSEKQQRDLLNNTSSVIYMKDIDGRYLFVNRAYEEAFCTSDLDIHGKTDAEVLPQEEAKELQFTDSKVIESRSLIEFEEVISQKDGKRTYISVKFPLKDAAGEIYAVCGISTDITARKQQEEELRNLRNYLFNVINSMPSILIGVDRDGRVTQWNRQAQQVSGVTESEAMARPLVEIFPRLQSEMARVFRAIQTGQEQADLRCPVLSGGDTRYEDVTIYPLITNGAEGAVIRIDDVTDRLRMEEMMIQSEKMLSMGGLAAGMAHEINNPLGGIMQTSEVMAERLTGELPANIRAAEATGASMELIRAYMDQRGIPRMLDTIRDACRRAATIVDNMLGFARRGDAVLSSCDLAELLDQTIQLCGTDYDLRKRYDFKQVEITREYETSLPLVLSEPQKIQQVLLNIFKNGAQAMQEMGGETAAERPQARFVVRLCNEPEAGMVRIEISDNGSGMDEGVRKHVFEPFFTTKAPGLGTGLGLSVAYFIVTENLGGTLSVASRPRQGSTFIFRLPVRMDNQSEGIVPERTGRR